MVFFAKPEASLVLSPEEVDQAKAGLPRILEATIKQLNHIQQFVNQRATEDAIFETQKNAVNALLGKTKQFLTSLKGNGEPNPSEAQKESLKGISRELRALFLDNPSQLMQRAQGRSFSDRSIAANRLLGDFCRKEESTRPIGAGLPPMIFKFNDGLTRVDADGRSVQDCFDFTAFHSTVEKLTGQKILGAGKGRA